MERILITGLIFFLGIVPSLGLLSPQAPFPLPPDTLAGFPPLSASVCLRKHK